MTESTAPKPRTSQRVARKATTGTPAQAASDSEPVGTSADLLRDLSDLVAVLRREPMEPGGGPDRLVEQLTGALIIAAAWHAEPHIDITSVRERPYRFAGCDIDVTVGGEKDAEALIAYLRAHRRHIAEPLPEPVRTRIPLPHYTPPQMHEQWQFTWRGLNVRIGTVIHPDDDATETTRTEPTNPETTSPAATADEASTNPEPTTVEEV